MPPEDAKSVHDLIIGQQSILDASMLQAASFLWKDHTEENVYFHNTIHPLST